jgi:uncharacterized protein YqgC (DUF456 family)
VREFLDSFLLVIVQIFLLAGLFGLIVPVFPGLLVMWLAVLGYGILAGWTTLGVILFILITVIVIAGMLVDNVLMSVGARKGGASWGSILLGLVAGVLGTIFFPPIGGIIAAPLAVLLLEYGRRGNWDSAWRALRGLATGWGASFIVRFLLGLVVMLLWWIWVWRNGI